MAPRVGSPSKPTLHTTTLQNPPTLKPNNLEVNNILDNISLLNLKT